jgi:cyclopropane-fatty-acyl-phospholipid synthase
VPALEELAERGWIPRPLVRLGIRRMIADRLRAESRRDPAARRRDLLAAMRAAPIALHAADANAQHYEVPAAFFRLVLGPRRKYSACLWPDGVHTLAAAEEAMLALTCERAGIADGQHVLDLGCGWGSLTRWMLERFPRCRVTAVSNSASQRACIAADLAARGLAARATLLTADMNAFDPGRRFDRVCSIEMFEHMRNWEALLGRVAGWLEPDGRLFAHVFAHRTFAYPYEVDGAGDWMARNFFTGGLMPSHDLFAAFDRDLVVEESWEVPGSHYARTCEAWLANLDAARDDVLGVLEATYGPADAARWLHRWRLFFIACAELFAFAGGGEWFVSHHRLRPAGRSW